jgi:hypothetical protein
MEGGGGGVEEEGEVDDLNDFDEGGPVGGGVVEGDDGFGDFGEFEEGDGGGQVLGGGMVDEPDPVEEKLVLHPPILGSPLHLRVVVEDKLIVHFSGR